MALQQQNKNYENFHLKSFLTNLYNKISKILKSSIFTPLKEAVLTQSLALLPPPLIFGKIPKCFDTAVLTLSSSSEPKITSTC